MNSTLLWVIIPGLLAALLFFFRRWKRIVAWTGIISALLFALTAWWLPLEETLQVGPWSLRVAERLSVAGRSFLLNNADRPMLAMIYLATAFWFGGAVAAKTHRMFIPLGLGAVATLVAGLAVQPFLYAALLIEVAVLLSVVNLSPPGGAMTRGAQRFLIYQTLAVPLILFAGWLLSGVADEQAQMPIVLRAVALLGLGLAAMLAIFPLHTWVPMLAVESHPYVAAFIFATIPGTVMLIGLHFLAQYPWLLASDAVQIVAVMMIVVGGLWAAFQRNLGKMLAYAVLASTGYAILAVSLPDGLELHFGLVIPRMVSFGVWALALSILRPHLPDLDFRSVQGIARQFPLSGLGIVLAHLGLAGFPLLANFPVYFLIWQRLSLVSEVMSVWVVIGEIGLFLGALRTLAVFVMGPEQLPWNQRESRSTQFFLAFGLLLQLIFGLFPHWFYPLMATLTGGITAHLP